MSKEIKHWTIKITWEDNTEEYLNDYPSCVVDEIEQYLTDIENERNEEEIFNNEH
tara:strand:+ start:915 stop:1079 length:165 start_codon:yes stop_codon:yes gene_type:complete